jgi:hypothetical protein
MTVIPVSSSCELFSSKVPAEIHHKIIQFLTFPDLLVWDTLAAHTRTYSVYYWESLCQEKRCLFEYSFLKETEQKNPYRTKYILLKRLVAYVNAKGKMIQELRDGYNNESAKKRDQQLKQEETPEERMQGDPVEKLRLRLNFVRLNLNQLPIYSPELIDTHVQNLYMRFKETMITYPLLGGYIGRDLKLSFKLSEKELHVEQIFENGLAFFMQDSKQEGGDFLLKTLVHLTTYAQEAKSPLPTTPLAFEYAKDCAEQAVKKQASAVGYLALQLLLQIDDLKRPYSPSDDDRKATLKALCPFAKAPAEVKDFRALDRLFCYPFGLSVFLEENPLLKEDPYILYHAARSDDALIAGWGHWMANIDSTYEIMVRGKNYDKAIENITQSIKRYGIQGYGTPVPADALALAALCYLEKAYENLATKEYLETADTYVNQALAAFGQKIPLCLLSDAIQIKMGLKQWGVANSLAESWIKNRHTSHNLAHGYRAYFEQEEMVIYKFIVVIKAQVNQLTEVEKYLQEFLAHMYLKYRDNKDPSDTFIGYSQRFLRPFVVHYPHCQPEEYAVVGKMLEDILKDPELEKKLQDICAANEKSASN